jgi:hypothetical protein
MSAKRKHKISKRLILPTEATFTPSMMALLPTVRADLVMTCQYEKLI